MRFIIFCYKTHSFCRAAVCQMMGFEALENGHFKYCVDLLAKQCSDARLEKLFKTKEMHMLTTRQGFMPSWHVRGRTTRTTVEVDLYGTHCSNIHPVMPCLMRAPWSHDVCKLHASPSNGEIKVSVVWLKLHWS